jgi:beta-RFAP synthase
LGLAVARAIALAGDRADVPVTDLAKMLGRGRRSVLGIYGFTQGGFLVEGGKRDPNAISPLVARVPFPEEWAILLVIPRDLQGDHGQREAEAFQQLGKAQSDLARTDALCRLVLLGMLPAILERDLESFGAALYDFNRRVGELFQPWQGGVYNHPRVAKIIAALRDAGVKGVGHSSWGPTVFAVVAAQQASEVSEWLMRRQGVVREEIVCTQAANTPKSQIV